ncbi:MAG: T9SS type A sorting domain-containing protein [Ignavibacteria bacterium]|nr:T9SS type A sorting domain-containing protein [Ignavibacteria bacterium]
MAATTNYSISLTMKKMNYICAIILTFVVRAFVASAQDVPAVSNYSVTLSAIVSENSSARITLQWLSDTAAYQFTISRKLPTQNYWIDQITLSNLVTSYTDSTIQTDVEYEYQITKESIINGKNITGYGYIASGINIQRSDYHGKMLLIIDSVTNQSLPSLLARYEQALAGDGWTVIRKVVPRAETFSREKVRQVKSIIQKEYDADKSLSTVFLFGRVAVPYSGNFAPDNHSNHHGAWAADCYYGDVFPSSIDARWSDLYVVDTMGERSQNWNKRLDGKFDQSSIISDIDLAIGRVDFYDMPAANDSELQLLTNYLERNIRYRTKEFATESKAIIDDNFGVYGSEAFAQAGWSNFDGLVGKDNVFNGKLLNINSTKPIQWAYGCGSGVYTSIGGVGSSEDFLKTPVQAVFMMLFGSYLGDWDSQNNVLRAALASKPAALATMWSGRPIWRVHPLGMGATLGECTKLTQNNEGLVYAGNTYARGTHIALLGDPTLTMNIIAPPKNLKLTQFNGSKSRLDWMQSTDSVQEYYIYRKVPLGGFERIAVIDSPLTHWTDSLVPFGAEYMVRARALILSPSGSYFAFSQGVISRDPLSVNLQDEQEETIELSPNPTDNTVKIHVSMPATIEVYSAFGQRIVLLGEGISNCEWNCKDSNDLPVSSGVYFLRISTSKSIFTRQLVVM